MSLGTSGFTALQGAATNFAMDGVNAAVNGLKSLTTSSGRTFMSYDAPSDKISLLGDLARFGTNSVRIDGTSNRIAITDSNGNSNVMFSAQSSFFCSNVGIGTTSPTTQLHFGAAANGCLAMTGANNTTVFTGATSNVSGVLMGLGYNAVNNRQLWIMDGANANASTSNVAIRLIASGNNAIIDAISTDGITAKQITIGNTAGVFMQGNVGIGTASPASKLTLYGTDSTTAGPHITAYTSLDSNPIFQQLNWQHNNIFTSYDCYFNGTNWISSSASNNYMIAKVNGALNFAVGVAVPVGSNLGSIYTNAIMCLSNQNMGVGNITPAYKLDVTGVLRTSSNLLVGGTASIGGTTNSLFSVAASGGASLNMGAGVNNKILSLYDQGTGDAIASASNFYGFGVNANTLRYQVPSATTNHTFYCGGTQAANFTSGQATFNGQVTSVSVTSSNITASNVTASNISASNVTASTMTSTDIIASNSITTTGVAKANKLSCGYVSVADFSQNQSQYSQDLFVY